MKFRVGGLSAMDRWTDQQIKLSYQCFPISDIRINIRCGNFDKLAKPGPLVVWYDIEKYGMTWFGKRLKGPALQKVSDYYNDLYVYDDSDMWCWCWGLVTIPGLHFSLGNCRLEIVDNTVRSSFGPFHCSSVQRSWPCHGKIDIIKEIFLAPSSARTWNSNFGSLNVWTPAPPCKRSFSAYGP